MNIFELFAQAKQSLKWPSLQFKIDGQDVKIAPTRKPNTLFISNGKRKDQGRIIYGILKNEGTSTKAQWQPSVLNFPKLRAMVVPLVQNPLEVCVLYGLEYNHCCFCGLELTNPSSVKHGYGPVCAEKWGLPWGVEDDEQEKLVQSKEDL